MAKLDFDKVTNAKAKPVGVAVMRVIDALQDLQPYEQAMGTAAAFLLLSEHLKVPAQDIFTSTKNLMNGSDGVRPEFRATRAYMEHVLK